MQKLVLTCSLLFSLAAAQLWGQAVGGTLSGRITSETGAGVPNAAVTITNTATNISQRVLTGADGSFSVAGLPPGTYKVDVETAGFKRSSQQNIELTTTAPASVNLVLQAGSMNETVEVKGAAPNIQGDNAEVHLGLPTRTVRQLPVIDRNYQQLTELQSGVTPPVVELPLVIDPARNRFFAVNGQTPQGNAWHVDGVNNREPFRGTAVRVQPEETIQTMQIVTATHTAEKGYAATGWVSNVTRGGTNDWHGSLFEFHSDNELRSRPFFSNGAADKPRFTYNQFGGTVGGRLVRDKTFFFGSYEGTYNRGQNTVFGTVPTAAMRAGNFSGIPGVTIFNPATGSAAGVGRTAFGGNMIPSNQINPLAGSIQSFIPQPNLPGFVNNFAANVPYQNDANRFDGRIDQHFSDRTSAFLRYGYSNLRAVDNSIFGNVIGSGDRDRLLAHNAVASLTHSFTPGLLTDFRFGYNRYFQKLRPGLNSSLLAGLPNNAGLANNGLFNIQIPGMEPLGTPANLPMNGVDNTFNWVWNVGWHSDRHNVRVGTDIRRLRSDGFSSLAFGPLGGVSFGPGATLSPAVAGLAPLSTFANSYAAFLLGAPSVTGSSAFTETPTYRQSTYSLYLGDNIQLQRRVNLDLGVRWDVFSPIEPRRSGGAMIFDPAFNTVNFVGVNGASMRGTRYDLNNVSPRVGLAFRPTDKTAIRAGYGINYFQLPFAWSGFMPTMTAIASGTANTFGVAPGGFGATGSIPAPGFTAGPVNGAIAPNVPLTVVPRDIKTPYVQTFNFQVQQEIASTMVLNLGYVGTLGRQLPYTQELNAGAPGTGIAGLPFAALGRTASTLLYGAGLTNNYNSLQVNLTKRFAHGLAFQGAYTFSKALGYTSGPNNLLINPADRRSNYGPLDYDRQHTLTISHVWELPFGAGTNHLNRGIVGQIVGNWQINGTFTWATGTPLTVTANPLFCNCPNNTVLANLNGPVNVTDNVGFGTPFFNTAAFSAPPANSFGSGSRGAARGPGFKNYNLSLFRSFPIRDQFKLEFRGEAYNLTNTPRFMNPVTNINAADFGQVTGTLNGAFGRQFNLGARILF